ncbi:MAG TPA: hypothetical protein ENK70_08955 [Methylophaga sp.]|nr:hypothetical protein [Methylophaga sp.]
MGIFKLKRGTEANRGSYTPADGEMIVTTDQKQLFLGDGSTAGGNVVGGSGGIDAGGVIAVSVSTLPSGYLKCNGSTISRTTYSDLFAIIGTLYGVGDGSTTFGVPDLRGDFIRGWDNGKGVDSGRGIGTWQNEAYKAHNHVIETKTRTQYDVTGGGSAYGQDTPSGNGTDIQTLDAGGTETRPRNVAMMYVIKY